ncbi:Protein phosphatase 1 regulatory subunit 14B [Labeo rohita]|uniref:Protein phosphatase 1 regulatory subunit 14B n=1 Tax=Labeo rohita TaxID=84645 RepID=A0ABQ8LI27_LABRO|nr:Protein phosphatase 1 regulatory subunit 14B [Labeo rohita]
MHPSDTTIIIIIAITAAMSTASAETTAQLPPAAGRVFFQPGVGCAGSGPMQRDDPVQKKQGKVTVKYDRKELRKRLILEEWIIEQLSELYDCEYFCSAAACFFSADAVLAPERDKKERNG